MDIKPIETVYNGYRFRSRLEARWAVFFSTLELPYEYELQGYELPGGGRYLPDFYLPSLGVHVEVKAPIQLRKNEISKLIRFSADADQPTLLAYGVPGPDSLYLMDRTSLAGWREYEDDEDEVLEALFWEALHDSRVALSFLPRSRGIHIVYRTLPAYCDHELSSAYLAAKQARFEHGEKP